MRGSLEHLIVRRGIWEDLGNDVPLKEGESKTGKSLCLTYCSRELVPEAVDGVGYGMPALHYHGKPLLSVMNAKGPIGLYPFSPAALDTVRDELAGFSLAKGTVRFTAEQPLLSDHRPPGSAAANGTAGANGNSSAEYRR